MLKTERFEDIHSIMIKLKDIREMKKLSQQEVADALGIERQEYSKFENQKKNISEANLCKISAYFSVPKNEIVSPSVLDGVNLIELGNKLRALRTSYNLSYADIAKEIKISPATISNLENAKSKKPNVYILSIIAEFLKTSLDELINTDITELQIPKCDSSVKNKGTPNYELIRIRVISSRKKRGITQYELASKIGMHKVTFSRFESGAIKSIKEIHLKKIANILNVDFDWISGKTKGDNYEREISEIQERRKNRKIYEKANVKILSMNYLKDLLLCEDVIDPDDILPNEVVDNKIFATKMLGNTMLPDIEDNSILIVHKQDKIENGQIGIVMVNDAQMFVKKVKYSNNFIELDSLNPSYNPIRFEHNEMKRVKVIGLVKFIIRKYN